MAGEEGAASSGRHGGINRGTGRIPHDLQPYDIQDLDMEAWHM